MFTQVPYRHEKRQRGRTDWPKTARLLTLGYAYRQCVEAVSEFGKALARIMEPLVKALAAVAETYNQRKRKDADDEA